MNQSLATPTAASAWRRLAGRMRDDPDAQSTSVGLLGVLLFLLLLLLAWIIDPPIFRQEMLSATRDDAMREFNIELQPDEFLAEEKQPDPARFVETNPEAPENTPDKTANFAAQNQQVSQPVPTPDGTSERPSTEGKKDSESNQIVSGQLTRPIEHIEAVAPPPVEAPVAEREVTPARKEQIPLPGVEKFEGENSDGFGGSLAKRLENATAVPEHIEGAKDAPVDGPLTGEPAIDPKRPRPRPQLARQPQVRPAILAERVQGTARVGPTAINARWSQYGVYLQRMIDTVQIQWDGLVRNFTAPPVIGSTVTVKFVMNSEGNISRIVNVDSTANELATAACLSAITDRAPYGPWTEDMRVVLGEEQEMTFTFHYQ